MTKPQINVVVTGKDEISETLRRIATNTDRLEKSFGSLSGRIKTGLQWHVTYTAIRTVERAMMGVIHAIPDLIAKGQQWAATVDDIADVTGMTARQSSELAAVQLMLGGNTESLSKAMTQLSKNVRAHEKDLKDAGVATRDANGRYLDLYTILGNLRNEFAQTGDRATAFGRAYRALGRGTREVVDLLSLNEAQYQTLAAEAQRAGLVMDGAAARTAETLRRTQGILDATITGLGTQILGGVGPVLTSLVNGISRAISDNMTNIVRFATQAVNIIAGLVAGLFGIDLKLINIAGQMWKAGRAGSDGADGLDRFGQAAKGAGEAADAARSGIERQIAAIEKQLDLMDKRERREDARREHQAIMADIQTARQELEAIRSDTVFAAGMSDAEAILARQAQAGAVTDAEKRLADAIQKLRDFQRDKERDRRRQELEDRRQALQDQLSDMQAHATKMAGIADNIGLRLGRGLGKGFDGFGKELKEQRDSLMALGRESLETGKTLASLFKDAIFGKEVRTPIRTMESGSQDNPLTTTLFSTSREGGLISHLQNFGEVMGKVGGFIAENSKAIMEWFPRLVAALIAYRVAGALSGLTGGLLGGGAGGGAATAGGVAGAGAGVTLVAALAGLTMVLGPVAAWIAANSSNAPLDRGRVAGAPGTNISSDRPAPPPNVSERYGTPESRARNARWALLQNQARKSMPWLHRPDVQPLIPDAPAEGPLPGPAPGLGMTGTGAEAQLEFLGDHIGAPGTPMEVTLRRYLGSGSDLTRPLEIMSGTLGITLPLILEEMAGDVESHAIDIGSIWATLGDQGRELFDNGNTARAAKEVADQAAASAAQAWNLAGSAYSIGDYAKDRADAAFNLGGSAYGYADSAMARANQAFNLAGSAYGYADSAMGTASSAYGVAVSALGNAATAQSTGSSAYGVAVSALSNAATAQGYANYGIGLASAAQSTASAAYSLGGSAYGVATSALANAATAQGYANYGIGLANTAQSTAGYGVNLANTAQAYANYGIGLANAAQSTAGYGVSLAGTAQGAADRANNRLDYNAPFWNAGKETAYDAWNKAENAQNRVGGAEGDIGRLWTQVWGKVPIANFKAFRAAQKVLDSVQNKRLNALEGSGTDKSETWAAMSAVSSSDGLAKGGYAPPGWHGWVGERGPELMRVGPGGGVTVASASRSAQIANSAQQPVNVTIQLDATQTRALLSGRRTSTTRAGVGT